MKRYLLLIFALCQYILLSENMKWQNIINYADHGHNFVGISKADSMNIMAFVDNELWSISPQRIILKSTDAGLNWVTVYQDTVKSWNIAKNIFYATKDFAIATCDNNYFFGTHGIAINYHSRFAYTLY